MPKQSAEGVPDATPSSESPQRHVAIVIDMKYALPWHQDCFQGIKQYGETHGWRCTLDLYAAGTHGDLSSSEYDGVVGRITADVAGRISKLGLPIVNLTRYVEPNDADRFDDQPGVYIDRRAGVRLCVEHLARSGYPRIGIMVALGYEHELIIDEVKKASASHGVAWTEPFLFQLDFENSHEELAANMRAMNAYLQKLEKPVGILVSHAYEARQVAHACAELGLKVPQEVGLVTRMGERVMLLSGPPTISAVEHDYFKQGYRAAAMLDDLMAGKEVDSLQQWLPPTEVVVRDSTDVFLCDDELVSEAMRYVAAHVHEELNVTQAAEAVGVSRWTLQRRFEEALGKTPQQEINRLRVDYLKRLLSETDTPIAEIGLACGFSDPSHLTRFFKREAGETPSAHRKRKQGRSGTNNSN